MDRVHMYDMPYKGNVKRKTSPWLGAAIFFAAFSPND